MITLYTFGPFFGLPDASPFVMKGEMLLKLAGLQYDTNPRGFTQAPKGKRPYIRDDGALIADSTLSRLHLEKKHGIDFDRGLSPREKGIAWSVEKMLEDHLYWLIVAIILCMPVYHRVKEWIDKRAARVTAFDTVTLGFNVILIFICVAQLVGKSYNPFIYFRFSGIKKRGERFGFASQVSSS